MYWNYDVNQYIVEWVPTYSAVWKRKSTWNIIEFNEVPFPTGMRPTKSFRAGWGEKGVKSLCKGKCAPFWKIGMYLYLVLPHTISFFLSENGTDKTNTAYEKKGHTSQKKVFDAVYQQQIRMKKQRKWQKCSDKWLRKEENFYGAKVTQHTFFLSIAFTQNPPLVVFCSKFYSRK